jgi:hypothetical protein
MMAASEELWTRLPGQSSWNRTAGTGQPGQDRQVRRDRPGQDILDRPSEVELN